MAAELPPLQRTSTGLTDAHKRLIRMLAELAVEQYLAETEPPAYLGVTREE